LDAAFNQFSELKIKKNSITFVHYTCKCKNNYYLCAVNSANMTRYLDLQKYPVFKQIFGKNPDLAMSFLSALMRLRPDRQIVELSYISHRKMPDYSIKERLVGYLSDNKIFTPPPPKKK
jgi:hypothetical protein